MSPVSVPWPTRTYTLNEPQFQGPFPWTKPMMPGVLIVEACRLAGFASRARCPEKLPKGPVRLCWNRWCALSSAGGAGRSVASSCELLSLKRQGASASEAEAHGGRDNACVRRPAVLAGGTEPMTSASVGNTIHPHWPCDPHAKWPVGWKSDRLPIGPDVQIGPGRPNRATTW